MPNLGHLPPHHLPRRFCIPISALRVETDHFHCLGSTTFLLSPCLTTYLTVSRLGSQHHPHSISD